MEGPRKRWLGLVPISAGSAGTDGSEPGSFAAGLPTGDALDASEPPHTGEESPEEGSRVLSRKELARELRRQAYQKAKRARDADPRHHAMKELAKQRRREQYQKAKEQRKAREAELAARQKVARESERAEAKRQLAERVRQAIGKGAVSMPPGAHAKGHGLTPGSGTVDGGTVDGRAVDGKPSELGRALARDIERALQCADVRELMERLRRDSAPLAARHQLGARGEEEDHPRGD